jgi:hypothetical protein
MKYLPKVNSPFNYSVAKTAIREFKNRKRKRMTVVKANHLSDVVGLGGKSELIAHVLFSPKLDKQIIVTNETYEELEREAMEIDNLCDNPGRQQFIKASRLTDIVGKVDELKILSYVIYSSTLKHNLVVSEGLWQALEQQHNIVNDISLNELDDAFSL